VIDNIRTLNGPLERTEVGDVAANHVDCVRSKSTRTTRVAQEHAHRISFREQMLDQVASDKTRSTRDEDAAHISLVPKRSFINQLR
jgi:hypothetical protein